ncbi:MAG: DUF503 domain-containing protein [Gemmataceae bacterium]
MVVGSLRVRFLLRESRSLKDKRQVVRSVKDRLHNHFKVAVAEVDALDNRQVAVLGIAAVSNDGRHVREILGEVLAALKSHPIAEMLDHEIEVY